MRIIGGSARGRRLFAPSGVNTRPTADRVREALFNILAARIPGARVLDPFGGSGSTLLACQRAKRKARIIEISPHYCDLIIHRFEELTGIKAEFVINISEQKEV